MSRRLERNPLEDHLDRLRATAYKLTGSATESQDLLHDCIVTALGGIEQLRQPELLGAWLQQILRSKWYDRLRRRQIEKRALKSPLRMSEEPGEDPDSALVARALGALSPQDREVLELKFFQSKSSMEIAAYLGCPSGTARSRIFHALRRFESAYREGADR